MGAGKHKFCWDACVYISLLTSEGRTPEEMKGLYQVETDFNEGRVVVFTSAISLIEVLECKVKPEQAEKFKNFLKRPDAPLMQVDHKIIELAHKIRNWYRVNQNIEIVVPDAIHLATAIHYDATAFHTFDGCSKRKREGDLLRLTKPIAGEYDLEIMTPQPFRDSSESAIPDAVNDQLLIKAAQELPKKEEG